MTWSTMSTRDRRAVLLGAVFLLPWLVFIWGVRPYRNALNDARDQLATERATLARERAAIATAKKNPQLQHVADSAMRAMRPRLFEGKDDVMASAELASYLGEVAGETRVWLQDAATRPSPPGVDGVRTLRVDIRAESDLLGTLMFLQALERGDKLVRVDRLDISRTRNFEGQEIETLTLSATVSGFAIGEATATAAPASKRQPTLAVRPASGGTP
jgi:hypothetical protein